MDLNKIVYMWFEREPFSLKTQPPQDNEAENVPIEEEPLKEEPPKEEPPKEEPPKEEPPKEEPDPIWNDPVQHFNAFQNKPLEIGFDTSKISFGIVQMVQHELNLLLKKDRIATLLPITGVIDVTEVKYLDTYTGQRTYQVLYDYIDKHLPELHLAQ